jgi:heterodisulfide reductase subunit C
MLTLKKENLKQLLNLWSESFEVYAPKEEDGQVLLLPYAENELTLNYINFAFPVKEFVFKQKEQLFKWERVGEEIKLTSYKDTKEPKKLLFGVRACDAYGLAYMDKFFLQDYVDGNYKKHRDSTYVVATNCIEVGDGCFCKSMKVGPFAEAGYDILLTPLEDSYLVEVGSNKGEELIALAEGLLQIAAGHHLEEKNGILDKLLKDFKTEIITDDVHRVLEDNFDDFIWEQLSKDCIRCTGCTSMCPTCTCFNVVEENSCSTSGCRVRCWDSCQSDSFTRNAGEHNPRNAVSRVRYRIYDKMKYIEERFEMKGCTGCGRCINVCPANINIVNIINKLSGNNLDDTNNLDNVKAVSDMTNIINPSSEGNKGVKA